MTGLWLDHCGGAALLLLALECEVFRQTEVSPRLDPLEFLRRALVQSAIGQNPCRFAVADDADPVVLALDTPLRPHERESDLDLSLDA